jgi:hypothetical protein
MFSRIARALTLAGGLAAGAAPALPAQTRWIASGAAGYATQLDAGSLDHGSLSVQVSALRPIGRTLALGAEAGWSRHDRLHQHFEGEDFGGVLVNRDWDRVNDAWHVGPVLRWTPSAAAVRPWVEAGIGLYGLREANTYRTVRQDNGQIVPEFTRSDDRTAAARPYDDYILGVGFVALQAGVTLR